MTIRLSKEHGLNPTLPQCILCGEDKGEIALLGAGYRDKQGKPAKAPMLMVLDLEPCDKCFARLKEGKKVAILEMTKDREGRMEPSGRMAEVPEEMLVGITIPVFRVALMEEDQFQPTFGAGFETDK